MERTLRLGPVNKNKLQRCCHCGSVFVDEKSCEACGFQFKTPDLGVPVGGNSFYQLREKEWQTFFVKRIPFFKETCSKTYRKALVLRLKALLDGLEHSFDDLGRWNYYCFELQDLMAYLSSFKENKLFLQRILLEKRGHPLFHVINETYHEKKYQKKKIKLWPWVTLFLLMIIFFIRPLMKIIENLK